ncbi:MAG: hypothetical protein AAGH60_00635 [Pseudomonadota bacterium]
MRISRHGNDLLVTDQSLGLGAFFATVGTFFLVNAASRALNPETLISFGTGFYLLAGAYLIWDGLNRLIATQIVADPDTKTLIVKRWAFSGTSNQKIPFGSITGFSILPEGEDRKTHLYVQTSRGDVQASGGKRGSRAAWEEVATALRNHMDGRD